MKKMYIFVSVSGGLIDAASIIEGKKKAVSVAKEYLSGKDSEDTDGNIFEFVEGDSLGDLNSVWSAKGKRIGGVLWQ